MLAVFRHIAGRPHRTVAIGVEVDVCTRRGGEHCMSRARPGDPSDEESSKVQECRKARAGCHGKLHCGKRTEGPKTNKYQRGGGGKAHARQELRNITLPPPPTPAIRIMVHKTACAYEAQIRLSFGWPYYFIKRVCVRIEIDRHKDTHAYR